MIRASEVAGGDADSNHHFRAAKHRVPGTLLGQSKLGITFEGRWSGMRVRRVWGFRGCGGAAADPQHQSYAVAGGDAGSNHYFRAANHRVLDTPLGRSKLRFLRFDVAWRVIGSWCEDFEVVAGGRTGSTTMRVSVVGSVAGSNHHFRAANHRVLDTLLGRSKLRSTLEVVRRDVKRVWTWRISLYGGAAADRQQSL